jgi:hypothetical protein
LRRSLPPVARAPEGTILGRVFPKAPRAFVVDDLDVGWDVGAYSSGLNTRETKPPPPAERPSKRPTHAPAPPPPAPAARKRPVLRKIGNVKSKPRP